MPRFRANVKTGPWRPGDVFESTLERHEVLAAEGYLTKIGEALPVDEPGFEAEAPPDDPSEALAPEARATSIWATD
jgi:hypothetical protein